MRLSPVVVVVALWMAGPCLGTAVAANEPGQTPQTAVEPAHDAAAHNQAPPAAEHDHAAMLAAQAAAAPSEIDVLVKKMNSTRGQAKIAIMADLITKLVAERQAAGGSASASASGGMCGAGRGTSAGSGTHDMSCPMCAAHKQNGAQNMQGGEQK